MSLGIYLPYEKGITYKYAKMHRKPVKYLPLGFEPEKVIKQCL